MKNFIKVGSKDKHLKILDGYYLVKDGFIKKGDLCANIYEVNWEPVDECEHETQSLVSDYYFVIRKEI